MDFYSMTNKGIRIELGDRIKRLRLRKNRTQKELAESACLSINAVQSVESGKGKFLTIIAVLRELEALDELNSFIPDVPISPIQKARLGKKRERATGMSGKPKKKDTPEW
ncbi:MAG: hypothetical protein A2277_19940 [Desulfobacterales bacterium RIFOXYA12_FULL_46_15]|nr:MAG: hypothetical protein A2277_19940 [Desulfobacterales bacterium RIFOXYA12_FULL_46_15]